MLIDWDYYNELRGIFHPIKFLFFPLVFFGSITRPGRSLLPGEFVLPDRL